MNKQKLPPLPCQFGSRWVGSTIFFEEERICCVTNAGERAIFPLGQDGVSRSQTLYSEIKLVELKLAPRILCISFGEDRLYLHRVPHSYYAVRGEPVGASLAYFKRKQVSTVLALLYAYASQARYNESAMCILNEFNATDN